MQAYIHVERDPEGLQLALRALLEEALLNHRMKSAMENADEYQLARLEAEIPERELADGYFRRAGYLMQISNTIELGIPMEPTSFTHSDVLGITALKAARSGFEREHPPCGRCGERQDNPFVKRCHACNYERSAN